MLDGIKITGRAHLELKDEHGNVKESFDVTNLVSNAGRQWLWTSGCGTPPAQMGWMALGTGSTAPANTDVALQSEGASTRVATSSNGTISGTQSQWTCTWNAGIATGSWTEAGIFNSATTSAGTMLAHITFGTITKNSGDTLTITWTITLS
ncbi:hypothetical protein [Paraburkholderia unamae]|uniref:Uncharacterized protein n=1 Tax=Paraburkholderia unamae TaxID=219649 RepID=A0ACC6RGZ2_9BURK